MADIGEAAANVIAGGPGAHGGKTYHLGGPAQSWDQVAVAMSRALAKPVKFVSVPDDAALKVSLCPSLFK